MARHATDTEQNDLFAVPVDALRRTVLFATAALLAGTLALVGVLATLSVGARAIGWQATTVRTGSMSPAVRVGDLVVTDSSHQVKAGDLVRFADPSHPGRHVLHRVIGVDAAGLVHTAGDANLSPDSSPIPVRAIEGVGRFHLPAIGLPAIWAGKHPATAAGIAAVLVFALAATVVPARRRHRRPRGRRNTGVITAVGVLALLGAITVTWSTSSSAYSGVTANPSESWTAGTVTISDDDGGGAMFTVGGLTSATPAASRCLTVTYTGNVAAPVKLYLTGLTGTGLGTYLNLTVEAGTGGGYGSCTGFSGSTIYSGTLGGFSTAYTAYSNGLSASWTPSTNGAQKVFRLTYSLQNNASAPGKWAGATLVWEAQG